MPHSFDSRAKNACGIWIRTPAPSPRLLVASAGAAVRQIGKYLQPLEDNLVGSFAFYARDETQAAGIVLERGIIQTLGGRKLTHCIDWVHVCPHLNWEGLFLGKGDWYTSIATGGLSVKSKITVHCIGFTYDSVGAVNLATLRLVSDVARYQSVTRAARLSLMSQSAASQALREVERDLGIALFDRSTRPLSVTPAGKLYLEYCRDVLQRHEMLQAELDSLRHRASSTVRLAAIYSVGLSDMSLVEERFRQRFPEADLQVQYLRPERVYDAVAKDLADLGLMSYAESCREIVALPWRDEEMVIAVAPDHPLSRLGDGVRIEAIEAAEFVGFDEDLPIQAQIDRYLRDHHVTVSTVLRFDNIEMIKQAVAHGAGISIMPERVLREDLLQGRLMAIRLEPPELFRPVRIVHRRRKAFNDATGGLLELLQEDEHDRQGSTA